MPAGNPWKNRHWSSLFTITSCGSRAGIAVFLSKLHTALKRAGGLAGGAHPAPRRPAAGGIRRRRFGRGRSRASSGYSAWRFMPSHASFRAAAMMIQTSRAAWEEVRGETFPFLCGAQAQRQTFAPRTIDIDVSVGQYLVDQLRASGREAGKTRDPDLTCRVEIPPGPSLLVYARKIPGAGGLPPNTAGRMTCRFPAGSTRRSRRTR